MGGTFVGKTSKSYRNAEEEGGYCLTNDRDRIFFKDRYLLDGSPDLHEFFGSLTDLIQFVEKRVGHPVGASLADVEEALEAYCETHEEEDCWFAVCEVEVVERLPWLGGNQAYQINAYRVLLTRARQGLIILIPQGSQGYPPDETRKSEWYDGVYSYLKELGIEEV